jgi:hypothetical protein
MASFFPDFGEVYFILKKGSFFLARLAFYVKNGAGLPVYGNCKKGVYSFEGT